MELECGPRVGRIDPSGITRLGARIVTLLPLPLVVKSLNVRFVCFLSAENDCEKDIFGGGVVTVIFGRREEVRNPCFAVEGRRF